LQGPLSLAAPPNRGHRVATVLRCGADARTWISQRRGPNVLATLVCKLFCNAKLAMKPQGRPSASCFAVFFFSTASLPAQPSRPAARCRRAQKVPERTLAPGKNVDVCALVNSAEIESRAGPNLSRRTKPKGCSKSSSFLMSVSASLGTGNLNKSVSLAWPRLILARPSRAQLHASSGERAVSTLPSRRRKEKARCWETSKEN